MMNKIIFSLLSLFLISNSAFSQNDFTLEWNIYEAGMEVDDEPFNGGFTIKNIGETTIPAFDTLWYGYIIEGTPYDIGLNEYMFSGTVLSEDFEPEDELSIFNWIDWPLWGAGIEIEVCAVVYGAGYDSYTGEFYTGDDDPSNNTSCLTAILPEHTTSIAESQNEEITISAFGSQLRIKNAFDENISASNLKVYSLTGQVLMQEQVELMPGQNTINLSFTAKGIYLIHLQFDNTLIVEKLVF